MHANKCSRTLTCFYPQTCVTTNAFAMMSMNLPRHTRPRLEKVNTIKRAGTQFPLLAANYRQQVFNDGVTRERIRTVSASPLASVSLCIKLTLLVLNTMDSIFVKETSKASEDEKPAIIALYGSKPSASYIIFCLPSFYYLVFVSVFLFLSARGYVFFLLCVCVLGRG